MQTGIGVGGGLMAARALLVAEPEAGMAIERALEAAGWDVRLCADGRSALAISPEFQPVAILIDSRLGYERSLQLCERLRPPEGVNPACVVAIVPEDDRAVRLDLLEGGFDDCWTVSDDSREIMLRARALARRIGPREGHVLRHGGVQLDLDRFKVSYGGASAPVTAMQMKLLKHLIANPGVVFSHRRLLEEVWGTTELDERTVRACVRRIRRVIEAAGGKSSFIRTVRQGGYAFDPSRAQNPGS